MIAHCRSEYPVGMMCRCLQVATSGFYAWASRTPGPRARDSARLWIACGRSMKTACWRHEPARARLQRQRTRDQVGHRHHCGADARRQAVPVRRARPLRQAGGGLVDASSPGSPHGRPCRADGGVATVGHCATTRPARASSDCSSGSACTIADTERATRRGRTCSITWSGSIIRECVVESLVGIGSSQP